MASVRLGFFRPTVLGDHVHSRKTSFFASSWVTLGEKCQAACGDSQNSSCCGPWKVVQYIGTGHTDDLTDNFSYTHSGDDE